MFRPDSNRDRTDYSGILMPPDGYRLDRAVGTTYSLDLEALTAVAICLGLSEETDSKLMQNPIGMLNALQKVSDKIVLFCEAGQIKVPTKPTALSILLEKMVVEVALPKDRQLSELEILQLSEFYEITARSGDDTIRRIIMIPTSGFPDDRESAAVNSVVKDRASFVEYIAFVLGDDYVASMLEGKQMGESGFFANSSDAMPALYEKMLKTSVEEPERIKDIGYVLKMVTDKDIIPDEFRELYETFCNTLKIRR